MFQEFDDRIEPSSIAHRLHSPAWERRPATPGHNRSEIFATLLDLVDIGILLVDEWGILHFANHAARREFVNGKALPSVGCAIQGDAALLALLRQVAGGSRRRLVKLGQMGRLAYVLPLGPGPTTASCVAILLGRRIDADILAVETVGSTFGLTGSERDVLLALTQGSRPSAIARERRTAISTVRTQIASLRVKLGVGDLQDLTRFTASLPPIVTALHQIGAMAHVPPGAVAMAATLNPAPAPGFLPR